MARDESFTRSVMLICFGTAALLAWQVPGLKWRSVAAPVAPKAVSTLPPVPANSPTLIVDLSDRRLYIYRQRQLLASYRIAVGQPGWETPTGSFRVLQMLKNPGWKHPITGEVIASSQDNPLGERWIGFWSNGRHQIGFHGTNEEQLIGKAVSHGCLRLRNQDIRQLYQQVRIGTPVVVRP